MTQPRHVTIGDIEIGNDLPLVMIAGPCVMESRDHALDMSGRLAEMAKGLGVGLIYKTSYDKANRTSATGERGVGLDDALSVFADIKKETGLPVLTDVHEPDHCARVAEAVDVLQIPAFLCRQTDLLVAAAKTGKAINVKKGQFLAPWDMANVVAKIEAAGNTNVMVCERGASFGYNTLISTCGRYRSWRKPAARSFSTPPTRCSNRAGRGPLRAARGNSPPSWRAPPSPSASPRYSWKPIRTRTRRRPTGPT